MPLRRRFSPLTLRLAAAFLSVAVVGVVVLSSLVVLAVDRQTSTLLDEGHRETAAQTAAMAARAYTLAGGWGGADLTAAAAVAASGHARLVVADAAGRLLAAPTDDLAVMMADMHGIAGLEQPRGHPLTLPVLLDGRAVGAVTLTFPLSHDTPAAQVRAALWRTAVAGTALAAAVALVFALLVAARLTRPLDALISAAQRLAAGERPVRVGAERGPGELGVLATAFDDMATQLDTEDRLRRQLVTDVAHELRTPLAILQGETEALLDGVAEADTAALGSLHDEIGRLTRLVADLETLSAADAAHLTLHHRPIDLADVAARAVATIRSAVLEAGLSIEVELAPAVVEGDADRLDQIALNLLSNAVKYTPAGGAVTVRTDSADGSAHLIVSDTGPGLPTVRTRVCSIASGVAVLVSAPQVRASAWPSPPSSPLPTAAS
jgi:two-component system, OmpR family, sensor histidine kinase BaeS